MSGGTGGGCEVRYPRFCWGRAIAFAIWDVCVVIWQGKDEKRGIMWPEF